MSYTVQVVRKKRAAKERKVRKKQNRQLVNESRIKNVFRFMEIFPREMKMLRLH